ncbi:MAG: hypothetical protein ACKO3K_02865 [Cuspidothrix sp.]
MSKKEAYKKAFESQKIPSDLADQCAKILLNDETPPRTKEEQKTIDHAYEIAFGLHPRNVK